MKTHRRMEAQFHAFSTSSHNGGELSDSSPGVRRHVTHRTGRGVEEQDV